MFPGMTCVFIDLYIPGLAYLQTEIFQVLFSVDGNLNITNTSNSNNIVDNMLIPFANNFVTQI